jgi:hypothetical protein
LQPWQPQERRLWFTIPDTLKERSILAHTHVDGLSGEASIRALEDKSGLVDDQFHCMNEISIDKAKAATENGNIADTETFAASGGAALMKNLMALVQAEQVDLLIKARALRAEIDKIPLGSAQLIPVAPAPTTGTDPSAKVEASAAKPTSLPAAQTKITPIDSAASQTPKEAIDAAIRSGVQACQTALASCDENDYGAVFEPMGALLDRLPDLVRELSTLDAERELYLGQVSEASELVGLLSYENTQSAAQEAADIVRQITNDLFDWQRRKIDNDTRNVTNFEQTSAAG